MITLQKGGNVSLSKTDPALTRVLVGLGWDERGTDGADFDLDASVFLLAGNGKVRNDQDFIFYNNLVGAGGSVEHTGDDQVGGGEGDAETIKLNLPDIPLEVECLAFAVTIHEAEQRGQNFGQVRNAFIRIVNEESGQEIARFDLSEDASTETAMIFGEVYRHNGEWKFKAIGQGYAGGLHALAVNYGVNVA